ncbi:MAG: D-aminoacylase [Candidatus Omnitrophica bacterium]|nr:D-aminoacylase [Candidatus Omnitrophota bacterium]
MIDILILGGTVVNGRGRSGKLNVGIRGSHIVLVSPKVLPSRNVIQASGKVVCPGFIDVHSHGDFILTHRAPFLGKVTQGVTTEIIGNCGISAAPFSEKTLSFFREYAPLLGQRGRGRLWFSWEEYFQIISRSALVTNIIPLVGHGNLKKLVAGYPEREGLEKMKAILKDSLDQGVWGFSTGLIYDPGMFSRTEELIALAKVVAKAGGFYATHIRGEGENTLLPAIRETITIGQKAEIAVQVSHLKVANPTSGEKAKVVLEMLETARRNGLDITYDQYPYPAASTSLTALLPPWSRQGGWEKVKDTLADAQKREQVSQQMRDGLLGWERIIISQVYTRVNRWMEGLTVKEISSKKGREPVDLVLDLLEEEKGAVSMIYFSMTEAAVETFLRQPIGFIGTDGLPSRRPHPRLWGSFPRVLSYYVREKRLLTLEEAVEKMSQAPAKKFGLRERGEIKPGNVADVVVFDPQAVKDEATFNQPTKRPSGIDWVLVNGKVVINCGRFTGSTPGKVLLKT